MAIVTAKVKGHNGLIKTYSDAGMMIRQEQTGAIYDEAIDVEFAGYTYVETDTPIEPETPDGEPGEQSVLGHD